MKKILEFFGLDVFWFDFRWYFRIGWELEESARHVTGAFTKKIWRDKKTGMRKEERIYHHL